MRYRPLGRTGWQVSEISLGTYPLGGALQTTGSYWSGPATYGAVEEGEAVAAIYTGLRQGLNFVDTAPVYGEAEAYIGKALHNRPPDLRSRPIYVETKCGEHVRPVPGGGPPELARDFTRKALRKSLEKSKQRLRADRFDAVLLHSPRPEEERAEDPLGLLVELRDTGQISHVGVSARGVAHALDLIETDGRAEIIQVGFNLLDPEAAQRLLPLAAERGAGIVIRSPLASGFLTGEIGEDHVFASDDHRSTMSREQIVKRVRQVQAFQWLVEEGVAKSLSEAALRYILSFPEVSTVIPGAMNTRELARNLAVSDLGRLPEGALQRIRATQEALGLWR